MVTETETRKVVTAWIDPELVVRLDDAARAADRSRPLRFGWRFFGTSSTSTRRIRRNFGDAELYVY